MSVVLSMRADRPTNSSVSYGNKKSASSYALDGPVFEKRSTMMSSAPSMMHSNSLASSDSLEVQEEDDYDEVWRSGGSDYGAEGCCSSLVLSENSTIRNAWNVLLALLLVYTGTIFPYRLCFVDLSMAVVAAGREDGWHIVEGVVDGLFYVDLFANFFFSFRNSSGFEVFELRRIAVRYLQGYFTLNLIACIPSQLVGWIMRNVASADDTSSINKSTRLPRLQRISRLARLTRLARLGKLFSFAMENPVWKWLQSLRGVRVINFFFGLGWAVHLVACGWYLTASLHSEEDQADTWVAQRGLMEAGPVEQWFHANYFVLTVFTTVGFGDMSASTMGEIVYVCFTMLVGAVVHSIIMSEVINIVMQVDQAAVDLHTQKELVLGFADHTELRGPVLRDFCRFFDQHRGQRPSCKYDRERMRALLTTCTMPRELMAQLIRGVFDGCLENNKLITTCLRYEKRMPPRFPLLVALAVTPKIFLAKELVYSAHDNPWEVFLVTSGTFAYIAFPSRHGGVAEMSPPECIETEKLQVSPSNAMQSEKSRSSISMKTGGRSSMSLRPGSKQVSPTEEPRVVLFPYQLFGHGTYFGEAELLLEPGRSRFSSARCESDPAGGSVLILHSNDLNRLCNDFPRFGLAWRTSSRRREERRRHCLQRLKLGQNYECLAAMTIQRHVRRLILRTGEQGLPSSRSQWMRSIDSIKSTAWQRQSFLSSASNEVTVAHLNALRMDMLKAISNLSEDISRALGKKDLEPASPFRLGSASPNFEAPREQSEESTEVLSSGESPRLQQIRRRQVSPQRASPDRRVAFDNSGRESESSQNGKQASPAADQKPADDNGQQEKKTVVHVDL